jgi:hypothetical protein
VNLRNNVEVGKIGVWVWCQHPVGEVDVVEPIKDPGVSHFVVIIQFHLGFECFVG